MTEKINEQVTFTPPSVTATNVGHNNTDNLCPVCHLPKNGMCMNVACDANRLGSVYYKKLSKAAVVSYEDCPAEYKEMLYSNQYGYNEGYFHELDELYEYCTEHEIDIPVYVWSTHVVSLSLDADSILESACDELYEDAIDNVVDKEELQAFLDMWCKKQSACRSYAEDNRYAIKTSYLKS